MNTIEIPLSKSKILLVIAGSMLFVAGGVYLYTTLSNQQTDFNPILIKGIGLSGILFFGATGLYGIKKLFDKTVGFTINDEGIIDNSNATSIGLIRWSDITKIETKQIMSTRFLLIFVKEPELYLDKVSGMKRKLMQSNMSMYGTPLSIVSTTLKYDFDQLEALVKERFDVYKKSLLSRMI